MSRRAANGPSRHERVNDMGSNDDEAIVLSSGDHVITSEDQLASGNVQTSEDDSLMASEDLAVPSDHMITNEDQVISTDGQVIHPDGCQISSEDHVIHPEGHVTSPGDHVSNQAVNVVDSEEDNDTAGEGLDTPLDSMTTDGYTDNQLDPIDFIETHPRDFAHGRQTLNEPPHFIGHGNWRIGGGGVVQDIQCDRWGVVVQVEDSGKKGKVLKRPKPPRSTKFDRMRTPYQIPRPTKPGKQLHNHPRPSPLSRKRRPSIRLVRPAQVSSVSEEGDMAQADEMGEGEGRDDGFVEGIDPVGRRRNKKRSGAIHSFLPTMGGASPPSSPSNEPRSRRRASSRKSRPKPRSRKQGKPLLASADISTQDSTTQGPGSTDTSNEMSPEDGGTPLRSGDLPLESAEEEEEEFDDKDEGRSPTPNLKNTPSVSPGQPHEASVAGNDDVVPLVADIKLSQPPAGRATVNFVKGSPTVQSSYSNVEISNGTRPHGYFSVHSPIAKKDTRHWAVKRQESDLSTAPFSSETSDMDTSGNERVTTADSMVDLSSDVHSAQSPPLARTQASEKKGPPSKSHGERKLTGLSLRKGVSGSSGDEAASAGHRNIKKPVLGKPIPSKPLPPVSATTRRPSLKSKNTASNQSSQSASESPVIPPRKPLPYQKNTLLLPNKVPSKPAPPTASQHSKAKAAPGISKALPSSNGRVAISTVNSRPVPAKAVAKPAVSVRPKPPINPKPRPTIPPAKPAARVMAGKGSGVNGTVGGDVAAKVDSEKPPPKPPASHRLSKVSMQTEESLKKGSGVRSVRSSVYGSNAVAVGKAKVTSRSNSPGSSSTSETASQAKAKVVEGSKEDKDKVSPLPSPSIPVSKPSVPSKPRRVSERRISKPSMISGDSGSTARGKDKDQKDNQVSPSLVTKPSDVPSGSEAVSNLDPVSSSSLQSGNTKNLSSSNGASSSHTQSPGTSPAAVARKSFHVGKSEKVAKSEKVGSASSLTSHKSGPGSPLPGRPSSGKTGPNSTSLRKSDSSNSIHKLNNGRSAPSLKSSVNTGSRSHDNSTSGSPSHRSSTTSHRNGTSSASLKANGNSLSSLRAGSNSNSLTRTTPSGLRKSPSSGSISSLSGSRDSRKKDSPDSQEKTKDGKTPKARSVIERQRVTAPSDRRTDRKLKPDRKRNSSSSGKSKEGDVSQGKSAAGGKAHSGCSSDLDSASQSVSEVSLTESASPTPSPFPSSSDLLARLGQQRDNSNSGRDTSRDSLLSLEESTPPPIPPREYLKSPEDMLALDLNASGDVSTLKSSAVNQLTTSTTIKPKQIASSVSTSVPTSPKRPSKGPRRPPPSPPKVSSSTDAAPTCNSSTATSEERPGSAFAEYPATKLVELRASRQKNRQNATSHYEMVDDFVMRPAGNAKYFEKHRKRDSVEPVNYSLVKHGPSQGGGGVEEKQQQGQVKDAFKVSRSPPPPLPSLHRPILKRAVTVEGPSVNTKVNEETSSKSLKSSGMERKTSVTRRPPPLPPSVMSSSASSYSVAASVVEEDVNDIYTIIDEEDKAAMLKRIALQSSAPSKQPPGQQRASMIVKIPSEDEPPPLPTRPAPKLKSPISPDAFPQNPPSKQQPSQPASANIHRGLILAKDVPPALIQSPKRKDPVYDVIPENLKVVRSSNRRRDYDEIVLPELGGEAPKLWRPPEKEKQKVEEIEEKKQPEIKPSQQPQQHPVQKSQDSVVVDQQQLLDDGGSNSGKSSPFMSNRNSTSSSGSGGPVAGGTTFNAPLISVILPDKPGSRLAANLSKKNLDLADLRENWREDGTLVVTTPPVMRRKHAMSFSGRQNLKVKARTASCRRSHSERLDKFKVTVPDASADDTNSFRRSCSLDQLVDHMENIVRNSVHVKKRGSSSEEEEEGAGSSGANNTSSGSSTNTLPRVPHTDSPYKVPRSHSKPAGPYLMPPDMEPLYQYINTAEFLRETYDTEGSKVGGAGEGEGQNQLALARQLSMRKLWCEQPDVISSGILQVLTDEERNLQEAIFEVISSEDTYLRSLDVLIQHFMDDPGMNPYLPEGRRVMDKRQHHVIFSNVKEVREVSNQFLAMLQDRQSESAVVKNISDIILDFAENKFDCYIRYCTNQVYQIREMQDIVEGNVMFREYLRRLESDKMCQNLSMQSFLLLPMQRITRLPLLILAILNRTPLDHPDHNVVESTLRSVQALVTACNDGARQMDRTEQLHEIHKKLDFGKLKPFPIVSASRQLERRGLLVRLQVEQKLLSKNKMRKKPYYLFVFTDYIIITKKKKDARGEEYFRVKDYASRAVVEVEWLNAYTGVSFPKAGEQDPIAKATAAVSSVNAKHGLLVLFLDNASGRKEDYILLSQNDTDRTRWVESMMRPDEKANEHEKIYERWDCPQVQALFDYQSQQPDELDLQRGDVVKVYRKMADGWYEGERLRDLQCGWFPSNFTEEIANAHTKARNLRQTHKLNSTTANARMLVGLKA